MDERPKEQKSKQGQVGRMTVHLIVILFVGLLSYGILSPTVSWILYTAVTVIGLIGIALFMYLRYRADRQESERPN